MDTTFEKLLKVLATNPRGLFMGLDELTVLLTSLNQYKGGAGSDRSHLLGIWAGKSVVVDRMKDELGEPLRIPHPCLSIVGNLVPGMLGLLAHSKGDDGMVDRWLYCFPSRRPKPNSAQRTPINPASMEGWIAVTRNLWERPMAVHEGHQVPHTLKFSDPGRVAFDDAYDRHVRDMNGEEFRDELLGPWSKMEEYASRLCLVLSCLHHAASGINVTGPVPEVGPEIVSHAWTLIDYFKGHHRKVRAFMQRDSLGCMPQGARLIVKWVRANGLDKFHQRELTRNYHSFRDKATLEDSLEWLARKNVLLRVEEPHQKTGRRPSQLWAVHPDLGPGVAP